MLHQMLSVSFLDYQIADPTGTQNALQWSSTQWLAVMFTVLLFVGIALAYRSHGSFGMACIIFQIAAIIGVQLSTKAVMSSGFKYPMCVSTIHFLCVSASAALWQLYQFKKGQKDRMVVMLEKGSEYTTSARWYVERFTIIAVMQTLNVVLNICSLQYIGAGFNALVGILSPVLTAVVACIYGAHIATMGWIGIALAVFGDTILSSEGSKNLMKDGSTLSMALLGIGLGIGAMLARSWKAVLMDAQMNHYSKDENCPGLTPFEVVAFQSPLIFVFGLALQLTCEGPAGFMQLGNLSNHGAIMLFISASCAVFLTYTGMVIIKMIGASAAQIAGKLNILITVALSCAFLGEKMSYLEVVGAVIVVSGAAVFEKSQQQTKEKAKLAKAVSKPTTYQSA